MTDLDLDALEEIAKAANTGPWHSGHLCDDTTECNCPYVFDEGHAGGIAEVYIDNGLFISEGGNDAPEFEQAKANLRHIGTFDPPTVLKLIAMARLQK